MTHCVVFSPEAQDDLLQIYNFITENSLPKRALSYTEDIISYCQDLSLFPERGTRHDEIRAGLRTLGYKNRVLIAFHVTKDTVVIDKILYGGQSIGKAFEDSSF